MNEPPPIPPPMPPVLPRYDGIVQWHGSIVSVRARQVPRFLWTTTSIDAYLDEQCILQTGGKLNPRGSCSTTFNHGGSAHTVELRWGMALWYSFPYELRIDGTPVTTSRVRADNWYLALIVGLFFGTVLGVILFFAGHRILQWILQ
jgi:hypothetical protein